MIIKVYRIVGTTGSIHYGELVHEETVEELPDLEELKDLYEGDYVEVEYDE